MFELLKYDFRNIRKTFLISAVGIAFLIFLGNAGIMSSLTLLIVMGIYIYFSIYTANRFRDEIEKDSSYLYFIIPRKTEKKLLSKALIGSICLIVLGAVMIATQYLIVELNEFGFRSDRTGMDMLKALIPYNIDLLGNKNILVSILFIFQLLISGVHTHILMFLAIAREREKRNMKKSIMDRRKIGNTWLIRYGIIGFIINSAIEIISKALPLNLNLNGVNIDISFTSIILNILIAYLVLKYICKIIDKRIDF